MAERRRAPTRPPAFFHSPSTMILLGAGVCPGVAEGRAAFVARELPTLQAARTPEEERAKLDHAVALARQHLANAPGCREWLDDPDLMEFCWELVASGTAAVAAWRRACSRTADRLARSPGEPFVQRSADVREAGRRVLLLLTTGSGDAWPPDAIAIAPALDASDLAAFDVSCVRGVCTVAQPSPLLAEFARAHGLPAVAGLDARVLDLAAGARVLLDGTRGRVVAGAAAAGRRGWRLAALARRLVSRG